MVQREHAERIRRLAQPPSCAGQALTGELGRRRHAHRSDSSAGERRFRGAEPTHPAVVGIRIGLGILFQPQRERRLEREEEIEIRVGREGVGFTRWPRRSFEVAVAGDHQLADRLQLPKHGPDLVELLRPSIRREIAGHDEEIRSGVGDELYQALDRGSQLAALVVVEIGDVGDPDHDSATSRGSGSSSPPRAARMSR